MLAALHSESLQQYLYMLLFAESCRVISLKQHSHWPLLSVHPPKLEDVSVMKVTQLAWGIHFLWVAFLSFWFSSILTMMRISEETMGITQYIAEDTDLDL